MRYRSLLQEPRGEKAPPQCEALGDGGVREVEAEGRRGRGRPRCAGGGQGQDLLKEPRFRPHRQGEPQEAAHEVHAQRLSG